jgi:transcription-repair coupling factor (superfamily II helicase)
MAADRILLGGAPEGLDARLLLKELERGRPVLHVARDDKRAEAMRAALAVWAPGVAVLEFPAWDCLPYDRVSPNPEISAAGWRRWPRWPMGWAAPSWC